MSILRTTSYGLKLIESFETLKTKAYLCPAGVPTIGIGHTTTKDVYFRLTTGEKVSKVQLGQVITAAEARRLFEDDVDRFEDQVENLIVKAKVAANPCEFDALVSLAFNIGIGAFKGSTVLKRFLRGDKAGAAEAMLAWNKVTVKGKKVVSKGLVRRREAERWFFLGDMELAEKFAQTKFGDMPRAVSAPVIRETMLHSATGNTALVTGLGGVVAAAEGVNQLLSTSEQVGHTTLSILKPLLGFSVSPSVILGVAGIVVAVCAANIWYRRWRRAKEDEVIEADPGVIFETSYEVC